MILIQILAFIFLLGLVIFIHELGHFIMAKKAGILCHEFSLGMGPILYSKKKGETLYCIRAIPIGGYVAMAGEGVDEELVKTGTEIKVLFDKESLYDEDVSITHIILNPEDPRYLDAERVLVNFVNLKGKEDKGLFINHYKVKENAMYVMRNKEMQIAPYHRSFDSKTLWQRFATIFAGPFMNFVLAFILFIIIAMSVGQPVVDKTEIGAVYEDMPAGEFLEVGDVIVAIDGVTTSAWSDLGTATYQARSKRMIDYTIMRGIDTHIFTISPVLQFYSLGIRSDLDNVETVVLGSVIEGMRGDDAGLLKGDIVTFVDGVAISSWADFIDIMETNELGNEMSITVLRGSETLTFTANPYSKAFLLGQQVPFIQVSIGIEPAYEFAFFGSFGVALRGVYNSMTRIFFTVGALFGESGLGVKDLSGPVGIFQMTSASVSLGLLNYLFWMAFLSVNLGILNLLPIPALDGGRIVFLGYEAIARKPVNRTVENILHLVMFVLLIGLMLFVTYNEILKLIVGE